MSEEKNYLYVDNANFKIEGGHFAAVEDGKAYDIGTALRMNRYSNYAYAFGKLLKFAGGIAQQGQERRSYLVRGHHQMTPYGK